MFKQRERFLLSCLHIAHMGTLYMGCKYTFTEYCLKHTESSRKVKSSATCQVVLITERENHCGHVKLPDDNKFLFSPDAWSTLHRIIKNWLIY